MKGYKLLLISVICFLTIPSVYATVVSYVNFGTHLNNNSIDVIGLNHGTNYGAIPALDFYGDEDKAYNFTRAAGKNITFSNSTVLNPSSMSISFWIKQDANSNGSDYVLIGKGDPTNARGFNILHLDVNDNLYFQAASGGVWANVQVNVLFTRTNWTHIVYTYENGTGNTKMYIDTILSANDVDDPNGIRPSVKNLTFGMHNDQVPGYNFSGSLDEVIIFDVTLNQSDVNFLYNNYQTWWNNTPTANWSIPTPASGSSNNSNVTLNASCSLGNVWLYFDNQTTPLNIVLANTTLGNWTTNVTNEGIYYYRAACFDSLFGFSANTSIRTWVYDFNPPVINQTHDLTFRRNNASIVLSSNCTDTNPSILYNLSFRDTPLYYNMTAQGSKIINYSNVSHGINVYSTICSDGVNAIQSDLALGVFLTNFTIYDETTKAQVLKNVSVTFTTSWTQFITTTNDSFLNMTLPSTNYSVLFTATGYNSRVLSLLEGNYSMQNISVFLSNTTSFVVFQVVDADASTVLIEGALIAMYAYVDGVLTLIESHYTDVIGEAQFGYLPSTSYTFVISKSGYITNTFTLDPVLNSEYTIKLAKSTSISNYPDYSSVYVGYSPIRFNQGQSTIFNFTITSVDGLLSYYGFTLSYPGAGSPITHTGNSSTGQNFSDSLTIGSGLGYGATVNLTYFYNSSLTGYRSYRTSFRVGTSSGLLMIQNKDQTYGLGLYERTLISTIIIIFVAGIGGLAAGFAAGLMLSMFVILFLLYIGFISYWAFGITLLVAAMILYWRVDI